MEEYDNLTKLICIIIAILLLTLLYTVFNKKDAFENNYYTMWENEMKNFKYNIGSPPGVMKFFISKDKCNDKPELIQDNVVFKSERLYDKCSKIEKSWP